MLDEFRHIKEQLIRIRKQIEAMSQETRHKKTFQLLRTVPGVGLLMAMVFRTELIDPERFADGRQISRIIGLAPGIRESGETGRECKILRSGNSRVRTILVEAAWRWLAGDSAAAKTYHRLVGNTGSAKKAIADSFPENLSIQFPCKLIELKNLDLQPRMTAYNVRRH